MSNGQQLVPSQGSTPVGTQSGDWWWDGQRWVCNCDGQPPCPPTFPPFGPPVFSGPVGQPPWYPGANGGVSFGTVAPPNPVRGHFWWDGTDLNMWDGAAWVSVTGGGTQSQKEPQFQVTLNADRTNYTPDVWNVSQFAGVADIDLQGGWDPLLYRWRPKVTGTYLFIMNVFAVSVAGAAAVAVGMNDPGTTNNLGTQVAMQEQATAGVAGGWLNCTGAATMRANIDYVRFFFFLSGTGGRVAAGSRVDAYFL